MERRSGGVDVVGREEEGKDMGCERTALNRQWKAHSLSLLADCEVKGETNNVWKML